MCCSSFAKNFNRVRTERFKQSAQKDMRKYSNIIERYMQNYVNAKS